MARCLGADPPYGCKHFQEHQEAARKGWKTRRGSERFALTEDHKYVSALFGSEIEQAHEHPEHHGQVRFKSGGKWYELPRQTFKEFAIEGKRLVRDQQKQEKDERREELRQARAGTLVYHDVTRQIRRMGGIRPDRTPSSEYKRGPSSEWKALPRAVKTSNMRRGMALDDMADNIASEFPELRIRDRNDLARYLTTQHSRTHPFVRPL